MALSGSPSTRSYPVRWYKDRSPWPYSPHEGRAEAPGRRRRRLGPSALRVTVPCQRPDPLAPLCTSFPQSRCCRDAPGPGRLFPPRTRRGASSPGSGSSPGTGQRKVRSILSCCCCCCDKLYTKNLPMCPFLSLQFHSVEYICAVIKPISGTLPCKLDLRTH